MKNPIILHIETSSKVCSIALSKGPELLGSLENKEDFSHARSAATMCKDLVESQLSGMGELDAVAVSRGPGSYTGLRIGFGLAKGLCFGLNIPLISISSLAIMATEMKAMSDSDILLPAIDARRDEVYVGVYTKALKAINPDAPVVLKKACFDEMQLAGDSIAIGGDGSKKVLESNTIQNLKDLGTLYPKAAYMIELAIKRYSSGLFEDLAYCEPAYLKNHYMDTLKKG